MQRDIMNLSNSHARVWQTYTVEAGLDPWWWKWFSWIQLSCRTTHIHSQQHRRYGHLSINNWLWQSNGNNNMTHCSERSRTQYNSWHMWVYYESHCNMQPWARAAPHYCRVLVNSAFYSRGVVKWVSDLGLNYGDGNNPCRQKQPINGFGAKTGWHGTRVDGHLALSCIIIHQTKWVNSCNGSAMMTWP